MKEISNFIIEKLKISKDSKFDKGKIKYIVLMSDPNGHPVIERFDDYEKAIQFTKYPGYTYWIGYKVGENLIDELDDLLIVAWWNKNKNEHDKLYEFVKKYNIKTIFKDDE